MGNDFPQSTLIVMVKTNKFNLPLRLPQCMKMVSRKRPNTVKIWMNND
jgi:hypothetical protein